jgi:hypothetical protein
MSQGTIGVSGGVNTINNAGTLRKIGPTTTSLDSALGGITLNSTGMVDVRNGTLNVNGSVPQISGTTLAAGSWQVYPNAALGLGASSIRTIGSGVTVSLWGSTAGFAALSSLTTNNGTLNLKLGGVTHVTPVSGTFTNNGTISIDADRWLSVNGDSHRAAAEP